MLFRTLIGLFGLLMASQLFATVKPSMNISESWARPTRAGMNMSAGYFTVANTSEKSMILMRASSVLADVDIHQTVTKDGISRMKAVSSITVEAGQSVEFKPGDLHLMLTNIKGSLKPGDVIPITFYFNDGQAIQSNFTIKD